MKAADRLPDFVEPMKAKLVGSNPVGAWFYEIKFDGYRALVLRGGGETRILSRNRKELGKKFTEVKDSIAALKVQDVLFDGEIVALDEIKAFQPIAKGCSFRALLLDRKSTRLNSSHRP